MLTLTTNEISTITIKNNTCIIDTPNLKHTFKYEDIYYDGKYYNVRENINSEFKISHRIIMHIHNNKNDINNIKFDLYTSDITKFYIDGSSVIPIIKTFSYKSDIRIQKRIDNGKLYNLYEKETNYDRCVDE